MKKLIPLICLIVIGCNTQPTEIIMQTPSKPIQINVSPTINPTPNISPSVDSKEQEIIIPVTPSPTGTPIDGVSILEPPYIPNFGPSPTPLQTIAPYTGEYIKIGDENIPVNIETLTLIASGEEIRLKEIPSEIGKLKNLKYLHISQNDIKTLPPEIGQLENLERFILYNNTEFETLPPEIGNLKNLKYIT